MPVVGVNRDELFSKLGKTYSKLETCLYTRHSFYFTSHSEVQCCSYIMHVSTLQFEFKHDFYFIKYITSFMLDFVFVIYVTRCTVTLYNLCILALVVF